MRAFSTGADRLDEQQTDARLLRPAVDPAIPPAARELLLAAGGTASGPGLSRTAPVRSGLLPVDPERRLATANAATANAATANAATVSPAMANSGATGVATGLFVVLTGVAPWAIGALVFQATLGWQTSTGRYAVLLMEMILAVTLVMLGTRVSRSGPARTRQAAAAARRYRGHYLTDADLDAPARVLLRRAQEAIDVIAQSEVSQAGLLDEAATLAAQEWHIAVSLREQARLRARRAEITEATPASQATANLLRQHLEAASTAEQSVTGRIAALERFAGEVRAADAAYQDNRIRARLADLTAPHLDMLARTAADAHGITQLAEMTDRARAIRRAFEDGTFEDGTVNDATVNDTARDSAAPHDAPAGKPADSDDPDEGSD
jgi:hypothetical protein